VEFSIEIGLMYNVSSWCLLEQESDLKTAKIDGRFLLEQDKEKLTIANILG
jgi:hypothetical protein